MLGRPDPSGRLRVAGRTGRLSPAARTHIASLLTPATAGHPWPAAIPSSWFGQLPSKPIDYQPVVPVNEAVADVVDHAYPPPQQPGVVQVHAWIVTNAQARTRRVTVAVTDRGDWAHSHRRIDPDGRRGHGLSVMTGVTAQMHIQRSAGGATGVLVSYDVPASSASGMSGAGSVV